MWLLSWCYMQSFWEELACLHYVSKEGVLWQETSKYYFLTQELVCIFLSNLLRPSLVELPHNNGTYKERGDWAG